MSEVERASGHGEIDTAGQHGAVPHEKPEDWGWNADLGKPARIAGWICVVVLALGLTTTHYNDAGTIAIVLTTVLLVIGLLWDRRQRKLSWRK